MKKLLAGCAAVLVLVLAVLVGLGLALPSEWETSAAAEIHAPLERVRAAVSDLRTWPTWTAWSAERDPTVRFEYLGEPGPGMSATWSGARTPPARLALAAADDAALAYQLDFETLPTSASGRIAFAPIGPPEAPQGITRVTWTAAGACTGWKAGLHAFLLRRAMPRTLESNLQSLKRALETGRL